MRGEYKKKKKKKGSEKKAFTSGKASDRKPPICGQTAGGQTEWTVGGGESHWSGTATVTKCLHGSQLSQDGLFGQGADN